MDGLKLLETDLNQFHFVHRIKVNELDSSYFPDTKHLEIPERFWFSECTVRIILSEGLRLVLFVRKSAIVVDVRPLFLYNRVLVAVNFSPNW